VINQIVNKLLDLENYTHIIPDLYLTIPEKVKDSYTFKEIEAICMEYYSALIKTMSEQHKPIKGVYVQQLTGIDDHFEIIELVFGKKGKRNILVGQSVNCDRDLTTETVNYLEKADFIACAPATNLQFPPDFAAEYLINLCQDYEVKARSLALTSQIMCVISYEVAAGEINAVESVLDYRNFWCKIVGEAIRNNNLPKIIMLTALEPAFSLFKWDTLHSSSQNSLGWWRRTHPTSYKQEAFVERVDEVFNTKSSMNCKRLCSICEKSSDCCIGTCVSNSVVSSSLVCRFNSTICEPHLSSLRSQNPEKFDLSRIHTSKDPSEMEVANNSASTTLQYSLSFTVAILIVVICLLIYYYVS